MEETFQLMQENLNESSGRDPNFFEREYRASSIAIMFVWLGLTMFMPIWYSVIMPDWNSTYWGWGWYWSHAEGRWVHSYWNSGTNHAWNVLRYSNGFFFGSLFFMSLLSYIHKRVMQKIYYRFIAWLIPASWVFSFWGLLAFIIGGLQEYGSIGKNMLHFLIYAIVLMAGQMVAWWQAPNMIKFYKLDEQSWWNYTKEGSPQNWPDQLGDFASY